MLRDARTCPARSRRRGARRPCPRACRAARPHPPGTSGSCRRSGAATGVPGSNGSGGVRVPDLDGASDELVAARPFHPVDAQVGAADADRVLRRPRAGRVVLGGDQAVPRVQRGRDGGAQVHVAQAHDQVRRVEHRAVDVVDGAQAVDPADELDVPRAPGRVVADPAMYARWPRGWPGRPSSAAGARCGWARRGPWSPAARPRSPGPGRGPSAAAADRGRRAAAASGCPA